MTHSPVRRVLLLSGLLGLFLVAGTPAEAAPVPAGCTITGYTAPNVNAAAALRTKLAGQAVNDLAGTPLRDGTVWAIPSGAVPVVVVDAAAPLGAGSATTTSFGITSAFGSGTSGAKRYVSSQVPPLLGSVTRTVTVKGSAGTCAASVTVVEDRSPFTTVAGIVGIVLAVVAGALAILFARRRRARLATRLLLGGAFGTLAGLGEALVLHESRVIKPTSALILLGPLVGLVIAALLALLRRRPPVPAVEPVTASFVPPTHAPTGRYVADGEFDRTDATVRYRAVDPGSGARVLLATVRPDAADPAAARQRLERHTTVLHQITSPVLPTVREVIAGNNPTLVTEPEPVTTLRQVLDGTHPLTPAQSLAALRDVLTGLAAVHAVGLVHRDVTPGAIHLQDSARLGLFELARPGDEDVDAVEGDPGYSSPEQSRREPLDGRSDIYTAGLVLSELLTAATAPSPPPPPSLPVSTPPDGFAIPVQVAALPAAAWTPDPATSPTSSNGDGHPTAPWAPGGGAVGAAATPVGSTHDGSAQGGAVQDVSSLGGGTTATVAPLVPAQAHAPFHGQLPPLPVPGDGATAGDMLSAVPPQRMSTGDALAAVPEPLAALVRRATSVDPNARPQTVEEFLLELDDAASTVYGPDWMTLGALTGAVLVPGAVIAATGTLALGGASAVAGGTAGATMTTVAVTTARGGATKLFDVVPALAGGATAIVLAVAAVATGPQPAAAHDDVLDPAAARLIAASTWTEERAGTKTHLSPDLTTDLTTLVLLPGVSTADLGDLRVGVPAGQTTYPAYFLATGTVKLANGSTLYAFERFERTGTDQPWTVTQWTYSVDRTKVPVPQFNDDGTLPPMPPVAELLMDPADIGAKYAAWGAKTAAGNAVFLDPTVSDTGTGSFLALVASRANVEGQFYNKFVFTAGKTQQPILLTDGGVLVGFTSTVSHDLWNTPVPGGGPCLQANGGQVYVHFGISGFNDVHSKHTHVDWAINGHLHIPTNAAGQPGKAELDDTSSTATDPTNDPC